MRPGSRRAPSGHRRGRGTRGGRSSYGDQAGSGDGPKGDTVVIAGKGHETGQEIAGTVHPFDDRDELRAALAERAVARVIRLTPGRDRRHRRRSGGGRVGIRGGQRARLPRTAALPRPVACSSPSPGSTSTGTTTPAAQSTAVPRPCSAPVRPACPRWSWTTCRQRCRSSPASSSAASRDVARPLTVVAVTGSQGKTTAKDMLGPGARRCRADRGHGRSFNNELGLPLTVLRVTADPLPGAGDGARGDRPPRAAVRDRAARRLAGAQRRARPTSASSAAGSRSRRQGRARRGAPARRQRRAQPRRPARRGHGRPHAARVRTFGRSAGAEVRLEAVRSTTSAGPPSTSPGRRARRSRCACSGSTRRPTPPPRPRPRSRPDVRSRIAAGLARSSAVAVADGAPRARRRPGRRQRRLQRQPRLDARRAGDPRPDGATGVARSPCWGRCAGARRAPGSIARWACSRVRLGIDVVVVGAGAKGVSARSWTPVAGLVEAAEESGVRRATSRPPSPGRRVAARQCRRRRRRPGQGVAGRAVSSVSPPCSSVSQRSSEAGEESVS